MRRESFRVNRIVLALGWLLFVCCFSGPARAQTGTSLVRGTVLDTQGATIAGATVTLTSQERSAVRTQTTSDDGGFVFSAVPPGLYRVEAQAGGFKKTQLNDVSALVNTPLDLTLRLEVGSVTEVAEISARGEAPINTTDATVGNTFTETQIRQLPLEGRNVVGLLSLQPGVSYIGNVEQSGETTDYRNGSVNGGKSDQANVTLDGVDVNDQQNGYAFNSVLRVTLDAVQEFRVTTTSPNAEQGRSSGAQIGLVTKSGSNDWHGSAYEFHRNTITSANSWFNNSTVNPETGRTLPRPKLIRNVFGASFGGPLRKDRLFFFLNYEGRRDAREETVLRTVPSDSLRQGIYRYNRTGGGIGELSPAQVTALDPARLGPNAAVLAIFQQYPRANAGGTGDNLNTQGFRFNAPIALRWNTYITRFDYNLTSDGRHSLYGRGNLQNDRETSSPQFPGQSSRFVNLANSKGLAAGYVAALAPTVTNTLRYGYTRQGLEASGAGAALPFISFTPLSDLQAVARSSRRISPVHNVVEDLSWVQGTHALQFGGNLRFINNGSINYANSFSYAQTRRSRLSSTTPLRVSDAADRSTEEALLALLGAVTYGNAIYNYNKTGQALAPGAPVVRDFAAEEYEIYGQDSWRLRPNLTFIYGLRYSLYSPPYEKNGNQVAFNVPLGDWVNLRGENAARGIPASAAPQLLFDLAGPANGRRGFYDWDKNNLGPRIAFAYSPDWKSGLLGRLAGGTGQTAIRAGFGILYDRIGASIATVFDQNNAFGLSTQLESPSFSLASAPRFTGLNALPAAVLIPDPGTRFPGTPPSGPTLGRQSNAGIDDRITTPYSMQFNLSVQRQLPQGFTLELAYVGRLGRHILVNDDVAMPVNLVDPKSGTDYFTAANQLLNFPAETAVQPIPYWENLFPGLAQAGRSATQGAWRAFNSVSNDYVTALENLDRYCDPACSSLGRFAFFSDQYVNLNTFRSIMPTSYHALQVLFRKRLNSGTQFDFNYTLSKSMDWASRVERNGVFNESGATLNTWNPHLKWAVSDFDVRHNLNFNGLAELPFGRGKRFGASISAWQDAIIGGWQFSGIWRWTSGLPTYFTNGSAWPTNWKWAGPATTIKPVPGVGTTKLPTGPYLFADPAAARAAYDFTRPGQIGNRNNVRGDGYFSVDTSLAKRWRLPYSEGHTLQFRWETFNLTNSVRFDSFFASGSMTGAVANFGRYNSELTQPRVMQFALRYEF